jgi:hypothetical protein
MLILMWSRLYITNKQTFGQWEDQNIGTSAYSQICLYFFFFLGKICLKWKELNMDERAANWFLVVIACSSKTGREWGLGR